jgi:hypothetical protein
MYRNSPPLRREALAAKIPSRAIPAGRDLDAAFEVSADGRCALSAVPCLPCPVCGLGTTCLACAALAVDANRSAFLIRPAK